MTYIPYVLVDTLPQDQVGSHNGVECGRPHAVVSVSDLLRYQLESLGGWRLTHCDPVDLYQTAQLLQTLYKHTRHNHNTPNTITTHGIQTTKSQHALQSQHTIILQSRHTQPVTYSEHISQSEHLHTITTTLTHGIQLSCLYNTVRPQPSLAETTVDWDDWPHCHSFLTTYLSSVLSSLSGDLLRWSWTSCWLGRPYRWTWGWCVRPYARCPLDLQSAKNINNTILWRAMNSTGRRADTL